MRPLLLAAQLPAAAAAQPACLLLLGVQERAASSAGQDMAGQATQWATDATINCLCGADTPSERCIAGVLSLKEALTALVDSGVE